MFSQVSRKLAITPPKTLPHMQRVIDELLLDKRHVMLDRVIDFKTFLESYSDDSLTGLKDSHQFRIAMRPKNAPNSWVSDGLPILQGKALASSKQQYWPVVGAKPLTSIPPAQFLNNLMLSEVRPLFLIAQPKYEQTVVDIDGNVLRNTDGSERTRQANLATADMDCTEYLQKLQRLRAAISAMADRNYFYCTRFPEETKDNMLQWWDDFCTEQEAIMLYPQRRRSVLLSATSADKLHDAVHCLLGTSCVEHTIRVNRWVSDMVAAEELPQLLVQRSQYSESYRLLNYQAPSTRTQEVAEYDDLEPLFKGILEDPRAKFFLVLSCGTDASNIDDFAGYVGEGAKDKSKPLLWVWVAQV